MMDLREYHPKWMLISRLIRRVRAGNKCEYCGLPNGALIVRYGQLRFRLATIDELFRIEETVSKGLCGRQQATKRMGLTRIVLTVAHIDHDKTNNRFDNLKALCQSCHLSLDMGQHVANRKYGRYWSGKQQGKLPFD